MIQCAQSAVRHCETKQVHLSEFKMKGAVMWYQVRKPEALEVMEKGMAFGVRLPWV